MVRVLGLSINKLAGMAAFNAAEIGDGAGDGTVDKSKPLVEMGEGAVAAESGIRNERMPSGLTSASGCHDCGGARPGGNGQRLLLMQDGE